ncbi:MAG: CRISPR-associated protein Cas4 [Sphingobacteriales bacterium]|nr:CRISPR-associated protein Cas4 [Sphingobacteriales bacterium]
MRLTATHINYYHICHRKLWLSMNGINMEHSSNTVAEGKLLHEASYPQRLERYSEIEIEGSKIDFYDAKNKVIHELKRSDKMEAAHEWQLKYYIMLLDQNGVEGVTGVLEYPKLRETKSIQLSEADKMYLQLVIGHVNEIAASEICPPLLHAKICKSCSYFDFCYSGE